MLLPDDGYFTAAQIWPLAFLDVPAVGPLVEDGGGSVLSVSWILSLDFLREGYLYARTRTTKI